MNPLRWFKRKPKLDWTVVTVSVTIYDRSVVCCFGMNLEEIIQYGIDHGIKESRFSEEWRQEFQGFIDHGCIGVCDHYGDGNSDILVAMKWIPEVAWQYGSLYHEVFHAVEFIAQDLDPRNRMENAQGFSEPKAYLFEFIVNEINRALWPK